jgi:DNA-directed RNA polymerase subunit RPC12/RpoP
MPYVDNGQKSHNIGHCRTCGGQWVVAPKTKGKRGKTSHTYNGQVCPYCRSQSVNYTRESNR